MARRRARVQGRSAVSEGTSASPFAEPAFVAVAPGCESSDGSSTSPAPAAGNVHVDDDDVFCDPVDSVADDVTPATPPPDRFPRSVTCNGAGIGTIVHHADLAKATLSFDLATTPLHAVLPH